MTSSHTNWGTGARLCMSSSAEPMRLFNVIPVDEYILTLAWPRDNPRILPLSSESGRPFLPYVPASRVVIMFRDGLTRHRIQQLIIVLSPWNKGTLVTLTHLGLARKE